MNHDAFFSLVIENKDIIRSKITKRGKQLVELLIQGCKEEEICKKLTFKKSHYNQCKYKIIEKIEELENKASIDQLEYIPDIEKIEQPMFNKIFHSFMRFNFLEKYIKNEHFY